MTVATPAWCGADASGAVQRPAVVGAGYARGMDRPPSRPTPEPLDVDAVPVVMAGTALWGVAALVLGLFARDWLAAHDATWWIWTCAAGFGLGLFGTWHVRNRRSRLGRRTAARGD